MGEDVHDLYLCAECKEVLKKPLFCEQGHVFCFACVPQEARGTWKCSRDATNLDAAPLFLANQLNELVLKCKFSEVGCDVVSQLPLVDEHAKTCPFRVQMLEFVTREWNVAKQTIARHETTIVSGMKMVNVLQKTACELEKRVGDANIIDLPSVDIEAVEVVNDVDGPSSRRAARKRSVGKASRMKPFRWHLPEALQVRQGGMCVRRDHEAAAGQSSSQSRLVGLRLQDLRLALDTHLRNAHAMEAMR